MTKNIFDAIPAALPDELLEEIAGSADVKIERIVSRGHSSPPEFWYDQDRSEFVMLLRGQARLRFEDQAEAVEMAPGDYIEIPAHARHRVEWTSAEEDTVWLAVHF